MDDVIEYLRSKGLQVHRAAGQEVTVHCPFCPDGDPKGRGKLYLNVETCLFDCKRCGVRGGPKMLLELFGDEEQASTLVPGASPAARRAIFEEYTELAHRCLLNNEAMMLYLLRRGLDGDTIAEAKIGYHPRGTSLLKSLPGTHALADLRVSGLLTADGQDFHRGKIIIPYLTGGTVVQVRGKDPTGKYYTPPGDNVRLYGQDELRAGELVMVVEGEFDRLILRQTLMTAADPRVRKIRVVGLPGAGSWPGGAEGFPDYFREARRVYLGLDPDDVGKREGLKLKDALGSKARIIELPEEYLVDSAGRAVKCDWTEYLRERGPDHPYGSHTLKDVVHLIDHAEMTGKRIYSTREAVTLWERDRVDKPGMALGFPTLDSIIAPGLTPGSLTIPLAKTGCIQGEALIAVNRAGKGFTIKLKDLVDRWEGRKYAWDRSIDTYVQREVDGQVRLGRLTNAWCSGQKVTYTVTTESGRTIRATDEHPFLTERGWLRLDELIEGDLVHVRGQRGSGGRGKKAMYAKRTVPLHPYAGRRNVRAGGHSVPLHRLVAEAGLNGLDVETFVGLCRTGPVDGLRFLDPSAWAVHHVDHDPSNNDPANLKVLTHIEHAVLHAAEGTTRNVQVNVATERVTSVERYGVEVTYDLEVADDPHNFLANGFVVHNTGKTVFLANALYNLRDRRMLMISLEQTAVEVVEILMRIHRFHNPLDEPSSLAEVMPWLAILDENRLTSTDFALLVEEYAEQFGERPEGTCVDYLGYYARGFRAATSYERTGMAVMQLKAEAKAHHLAVIAPHQVSRRAEGGKAFESDAARDSGVIEETGDYVFGFFRPGDAIESGTTPGMATSKMMLKILKSRRGGQGKVIALRMSPASLRMVDAHDQHSVNRIEQELVAINRGEHYGHILSGQREAALQARQTRIRLVG